MRDPRCAATLTLLALATIGFATRAAFAQGEPATSRGNTVSVSGCLRSADQVAVGTSGSSSTGASGSKNANDSSTKFVLTNVTSNSSSPESATGATGAKPGMPVGGYRLDGDASKLSEHVGHKGEISGTIENPGSTAPAGDDIFSSAPRVKVLSIRTLASNCGQ
jgi:hypothetical protein